MTLDIPHIIATAIIMLALPWLVDHASAFENMTKGRKSLFQFANLFAVLFVLNLVWL